MKQCPRCQQTYSDDSLNFCLNDGELLMAFQQEPSSPRFSDPPPTVVMDQARRTNPVNWSGTASPPAQWSGTQQQMQQQPFGMAGAYTAKRDQTMPTIALILGILSLPLMCCYGGIWLGLPAAVLGFLGMRNADKDPTRYGGRGMAIGGMVLGIIGVLATIAFIFIAIIGNIAS